MQVSAPPIKSQGIKIKLVPWIGSVVPEAFTGRWIEPFMGTGAVGFNIAPRQALMCDANPHLINFYQAIKGGEITAEKAREFLRTEGSLLLEKGDKHYYAIRDRFNNRHQPLDFLFVNRAGFNGMIRFNRSGKLNTPFCRKPNRFTQAYVTKIANQIMRISLLLATRDFTFKCQSFEQTILEAGKGDIIYCDPPYIGRHVDYHGSWDSNRERELFTSLSATKARFILSTWHHNDFRKNEYVQSLWSEFNICTREHFYHVGASERNRNPVTEAIVTNYAVSRHADVVGPASTQQAGQRRLPV